MLSSAGKALVLFEVILCLGPLTIFLGGGLVLIPMIVVSKFEASRLLLVIWMLAGCVGLFALISTLLAILAPAPGVRPSVLVLPFYIVGILALLPLLFIAEDVFSLEQLLLSIPLLAALHIMYLARAFLFKIDTGRNSVATNDA